VAFAVRVQLRGKDPAHASPVESRQEAERQIDLIRAAQGADDKPEIMGLAVVGNDVVGADIIVANSDPASAVDMAAIDHALNMLLTRKLSPAALAEAMQQELPGQRACPSPPSTVP
jgi:hypothetical protein